MALLPVDNPRPVLPPSDLQKMKSELQKIDELLKIVNSGKSTKDTYEKLLTAVEVVDEIILSLDNSNDFFKIGGFNQLMPLLACSDDDVVAAAAELVADLCQNNSYCQAKMLDFNVMPQLVSLIDTHSNSKVRFKALYALSCLCRHNDEGIKQLEITNFLPVLLHLLQQSDERLRAKAAFFLSYLTSCEHFREALYQADIVGILLKLLSKEQDSSSEHLLRALETQLSHHKQSRVQSRLDKYNMKQLLQSKIQLYESESKYAEVVQHCNKIFDLCFHDQNNS